MDVGNLRIVFSKIKTLDVGNLRSVFSKIKTMNVGENMDFL